MPVPLHDLSGKRCRLYAQFFANRAFDLWIDMGMGTDRAADLTYANALACLDKALFCAPEFVEHERKLQTKCDRLGVNAMATPNHRRHLESPRLFSDCRP